MVMTGSANDSPDWQDHIRSKARNRAIADHFRDPGSPMKLAIVCDMWLTGFDVPSRTPCTSTSRWTATA